MKKEDWLLILSTILFLFVLFTPCPENYGTPQTINGLTYIPWVVPFISVKINLLLILGILIILEILYIFKGGNNEESTNHS